MYFLSSITKFYKEVKAETAKIVWPTGKETIATGGMVTIIVILFSIFFATIDYLFFYLVRFFII